jgi:putative toxin-antitoxin system antitoxin component (TIGR02293 family)
MTKTDEHQALAALRARGAEARLVDKIAASGLPAATALRAIQAIGLPGRLRRWLRPDAPLSEEERQRLAAVATIAADVDEMEGGAANAGRFWDGAMPWLGGKTPAQALVRRDGPGVIEDLVTRIKYGIYS